MDFKEWALTMYPFWILGILVILAVLSTKQKSILRVDKPAILDWIRFLVTVTAIRFCIYKLFPHFPIFDSMKHAALPPIGVGLTVFWEDMVHGLPLLLLRKLIGVSKWTKPIHFILLCLVMLEFGLGHMYQGAIQAIALSFYVPYSIKIGEKYGFGTVMLGHMLYDSFSMVFIRCLMGL